MGYDELLRIIKENQKEETKEIVQCPQCAYVPLKVKSTGEKACPICGWQSGG